MGGEGGGSKRGDTIFDLDLGGEKPWGKTYVYVEGIFSLGARK